MKVGLHSVIDSYEREANELADAIMHSLFMNEAIGVGSVEIVDD